MNTSDDLLHVSRNPILAWKSARDIADTEPDRHDYLQDMADNARCNDLNSIDKLHLSERAKHATHIALMLDDPSAHVRLCAMEMLYTLNRTALIPHAHTILQRLTDSSVYVRLATLVTFRKIDDLAVIFASTVVDMLAEPCTDVVCEAFLTLTNFIGATPAIDEPILANILTNASAPPTVLIRAMEYVVELDSTSVEHHARAIADSLHHADSDVRYAALDALSQLEEHALVPHATAIASLLDDADPDVVRAASNALGQLPPEERTRAQQRAKDIKIKARARRHWATARAFTKKRSHALFWHAHTGKKLCAPSGKWAKRDMAAYEREFG
jgi:HEAT repeat protein